MQSKQILIMNNLKISVDKGSVEWLHIQYRLQLFLGLPAATPISIFRFESAAQELKDMEAQYHQGKVKADACINTTDMDDQQFKRVFSRKAQMKSLVFQTGHLLIDSQNEPINKRYSMLLVKIMIGDTYCIPEADVELLEAVPEGYDSCYLTADQEQAGNLYRHDYILKNRGQYVVQYELVFSLSRQKQYNARDTICNKCQKRVAVAYCKQEEAYFCSQCNVVHHKDKLLSNHVREPISKLNSLGRCMDHGKHLDLYCKDCSRFLCVQCTLSGDHSGGEKASHAYILLEKFYNDKEVDNQRQAQKKKEDLGADLSKIEGFIKQVSDHTQEIYNKIKQKYEKAVTELKRLNKQKIDELLSYKVQIKRQLDQCVWTESFIKYQQQVLKPQYYVEAQIEFQSYIRSLNQTRPKQLKFYDTDTIQIIGDVAVSEKSKKSRSNSSQRKQRTGLDFYERNQDGDNRSRGGIQTPKNSQVRSKLSELYSQDERKNNTPSGKQSNISQRGGEKFIDKTTGKKQERSFNNGANQDGSKIGKFSNQSSISPGLPIRSKDPYHEEDTRSWKRSNQTPSNATPPPQESPSSKYKASQILKEKFGQLGFKNSYV